MTTTINSSTVGSVYGQLFAASSNWLAGTYTAIQNSNNAGGIFAMLRSAGGDGSISSFLGNSTATANAFAQISQNSVTNASSLVAQIASQNLQTANANKLQDALDDLSATQQMVRPKNVLDPIIFLSDGSTIDTTSNILTMANGTQIDTTTGTKVIDTASIIQLANGAYLDTKNNVMTMADGTEIDTVTGLKLSVTA
jgi:hypothetical protein